MSYYAKHDGVGTGDAPQGAVEITKEQYQNAKERMAGGERLAVIDGALTFYHWPVQLIDENGFYAGEADVLPKGAPLITERPEGFVKPKWDGEWVEGEDPAVIAAALIPRSVTRFQALAALHQAGHLETVQAMMAEADPLAKLAFDNALTFERNSPTVLSMGAALGLDSAQLDALFTQAATITA